MLRPDLTQNTSTRKENLKLDSQEVVMVWLHHHRINTYAKRKSKSSLSKTFQRCCNHTKVLSGERPITQVLGATPITMHAIKQCGKLWPLTESQLEALETILSVASNMPKRGDAQGMLLLTRLWKKYALPMHVSNQKSIRPEKQPTACKTLKLLSTMRGEALLSSGAWIISNGFT